MATEVQQSLNLSQSERHALDRVIQPHLRLEPYDPSGGKAQQSSTAVDSSLTKRSAGKPTEKTNMFSHHAIHPTTTHPEAIHPGAFHPEAFHPEAFHPEVFHPETIHPTVIHPTAIHPTATYPTAIHPTATHSTAIHPTATHPPDTTRQIATKRGTVHKKSTVESDNKTRPIVLRRNASKYAPPSPETPDPNSEAKSVTIRRMQGCLEDWNKQLGEIMDKKERDDVILQSEIEKRDTEIDDLKQKYSSETKLRIKVEKKRDNLSKQLKNTEDDLNQRKRQLEHVQNQLAEYELAYEQLDAKRLEVEEELQTASEQLQQSETMRRRLNDHVTELQGQLAIEEQRSKICSIQ